MALATAFLVAACAGMRLHYGRHWYLFIFPWKPQGIIIHHTESSGYRNGRLTTVADIDAWHASKGWGLEYKGKMYHVGYHYVILADGTVEPGRPECMRGAHTKGHNHNLGVCLVGNFSSSHNPDGKVRPARPTDVQLASLQQLVCDLMTRHRLTVEDIHRHTDYSPSDCPGDRFPFAEFVESVRYVGRDLSARPAVQASDPPSVRGHGGAGAEGGKAAEGPSPHGTPRAPRTNSTGALPAPL